VKTLLYGLLGLAVLLVAAVLLGPRFIDWTAYKETVSARLGEVTGREVTIAGRVNVEVLPRPTLTLNGLRVANAPGGRADHLLRADELRLTLGWAPLLRANLALEAVELAAPRVVLESNGEHGPNWRGLSADALPADLAVDALTVADGRIVYRDLATDRRHAARRIDARLQAETLRGPFAGEGRFTLHGQRLTLDGQLGELTGGGTVPYSLDFGLTDGAASAAISGGLERADDGRRTATATLSASGPSLAATLQRFGVGADPALDRSFATEAELTVDAARARADSLSLVLGEAELDGSATLAFADTPRLDAELSAQRLSLDRLRGGADGPLPLPWTRAAWRWFGGLSAVEGRIGLDVAALIHRGQAMRQARLDLALTGDGVRIPEARALIPGSGRARVQGRVTLEGDAPVFDGEVELAASSLRRTLRWLELEPDAVAADRLRRLDITSGVRARPGRITFSELDGEIDGTAFEGGVAIALRDRPGFGIGLRVPTLRLGGYLGPLTSRPLDEVMAVFGRFDANLDLRADTLVYRGRRFGEVRLKGGLDRGTLSLETGRVGELAGGTLTLDGTVAGLDTTNPDVDLNANLAVREAERFADFAGLGAVVPPRAGEITLGGTLSGRPRRLTVNLNLDALDGLAAARGLLQPAASPPSFQGTLKLVHDDVTALARQMPGAPRLPAVLGGMDLSGEATATPGNLTLHKLAGTLGPMEVAGSLSTDWTAGPPATEATLSTPRLPLSELLAGAWAAGGGELRTRWLRGHDTTLRLTADRMVLGRGLAMTDARLDARTRGGTLTVSRVEGGFAGGRVKLSGNLTDARSPKVSAQAHATGIGIGPVLSRLGGGKPVTGTLDVRAEASTAGRQADALLRGLGGEASVTGTLSLAPGAAAAIRERAGGREDLLDAFAGRTARLSGAVEMDGGVATTADATLSGDGARARLTGKADLPQWRSDATIEVVRPDAGEPVFTARLTGPLDAPSVTLEAAEPPTPAEPALDLPVEPETDAPPLPDATAAEPEPPATEQPRPDPAEPAIGRVAPEPEVPAIEQPGRTTPEPERPAIGPVAPPAPDQPAIGTVTPREPEPQRPAIKPAAPSVPQPERPAIGPEPQPVPEEPALPVSDGGESAAEDQAQPGDAESIIEGVIEEYGE